MRPLRDRDPEIYRLITIRTLEARLWISPSSNVRKMIGGVIARYQEIFKVKIYAYCILSNHLHLLIKAGNTDEFLENVNREIARRVNWLHRREGKFWSRRYDDQEVLSRDDLLECFLYINTNPTRHGLIRDSREWPLLNSFEHCLNEKDRHFSFHHYSKGGLVTKHVLKLSPLPQFEDLTQTERSRTIKELLTQRLELIAKEKQSFLGLAKLLIQTPGEIPLNVSRSERPACYTQDAALRREFKILARQRRERYDLASMRYRLELVADFPEHSFKPPVHRTPRVVPFTPLTPDFFKNAA